MLACLYLVLSRLWSKVSTRSSDTPEIQLHARVRFLAPAGLLLLFALHGASAIKVLIILYLNYKICHLEINHRLSLLCIWTFNIAVLFTNKAFDGYRFGNLLSSLSFLVSGSIDVSFLDWTSLGLRTLQRPDPPLAHFVQHIYLTSSFVCSGHTSSSHETNKWPSQ